VAVPWSAVADVTVRSRRVAYLSDLKPTAVQQRSIAFLDVPWRRDRSVMGRTLTLAGRTFEKGIGVHATSRLTFAAGGKYDELAAEIGIDAETSGNGDCVFSVLADGETLFSSRVRGADPPQSIRLDIGGKQEVVLVVEAGEGLDLADHADWCDVRLIKAKK
jgi:NPCBM/NEW2 domain-containing protein